MRLGVDCREDANINISIYGFPSSDTNSSKLIGMSGAVTSISDNKIQYDIDTTFGQSGSPLILEYAHGLPIAIGIHLGKDDKD